MRLVRLGSAAVSVKVGDFAGNGARLAEAVQAARAAGVHLLVTPELGLSGYSLEDRIYWPDIARHSWTALKRLAKACTDITVVAGLPVRIDGLAYNAAAFITDREIQGLVLKKHLPTYSIFYEGRNWNAWPGGVTSVHGVPAGDLVFELPFGRVSAEICEDLWAPNAPARERVRAGAEIICNPSASPFTPRKNEERKRLIQGMANSLKSVYVYANLLGCDSSRIIFDGGGIVATPDRIVAEGPLLSKAHWTLCHGVVDLDEIGRLRTENTTWRLAGEAAHKLDFIRIDRAAYTPAPMADYVKDLPPSFYLPEAPAPAPANNPAMDELFDGLVLGLRDYFEKVGAFERFLIALSGGRDSALCLLVAVEAAKALEGGAGNGTVADRVETVYLPNRGLSTNATEEAARNLAEALGVPFRVFPIAEEAALAERIAGEILEDPAKVVPIAKQNLQARIRGAMMLNWANSAGGLVLVTSNLSEAAVGYTTTGGDNEGGYSPIANVPKTLVSELLAYLAQRDGIPALDAVLAIPPTAELAPDQQDETDLMPYAVLDDILYLYARQRRCLVECWKLLCHRHPEHDPEQLRTWAADFAKRFAANQWKRDQHPVALKVMDLDLDPKTGFRFPVTQSIQHELDELAAGILDET